MGLGEEALEDVSADEIVMVVVLIPEEEIARKEVADVHALFGERLTPRLAIRRAEHRGAAARRHDAAIDPDRMPPPVSTNAVVQREGPFSSLRDARVGLVELARGRRVELDAGTDGSLESGSSTSATRSVTSPASPGARGAHDTFSLPR